METAHGFAAPAVSALARGIREYSLFQAVLLVMDRLRQEYPGLGDEALYDQLEFQANPSLGFPGSDVDRVEFFEERGMLRARLRFNLIGLFGASSPLPAFYSEQALGDSEEGNPTRNFLDLFQHRLHRGLPLRGLRTELTIDPEGYIGEGDLFVFASVLNEFFALYASINSYHELRVRSTQGDVYQWKPRMGLQPLL